LKRITLRTVLAVYTVAPFAGAWIETALFYTNLFEKWVFGSFLGLAKLAKRVLAVLLPV